ncbi:hypothetical protein [Cryptosporangium phraense]|uniref:hypothetical protein n=1 Tax=Cryptosporangium phraense TaxID=2593070 RepID=UPI0014781725|nr:hypothetical protein [Cryptosporangium phraense]
MTKRVHPAAPGVVLLVSCVLVDALPHGAPRLAAALLGLLLTAYLSWLAFSPSRFFAN